MLYFHLDSTNFLDTLDDGTQNIGPIQSSFFCNVFSSLCDAKCYANHWSEDPEFAHVPALKGQKWLLCSIDDESVETAAADILLLMEQAHSTVIPGFGKSLKDLGLHYDFIVQIPNSKVKQVQVDYLAENNLQYLEEAVGDRNMSLSEKIALLSSELLKIGSSENQLTIVDPYIFPKKHDEDYCELFLGVIQAAKVSSIKIVTDQQKYNSAIYNSIQSKISELSIPMNVFFSEKYHDRWWIIENKRSAIMCGTSLNGFGKGKLSSISIISEQDVDKIVTDISTVTS